MCGVVGWVDFERDLTQEHTVAEAMTDALAHRGPDGAGLWSAPHVILGHRRLAVIDHAGGHQPMVAEQDGRPLAVITYSSEVYNFRELRAELSGRGHRFRTGGDTEVVLRAYLDRAPEAFAAYLALEHGWAGQYQRVDLHVAE